MNLISPTDIVKKSIELYKQNKDFFARYVKLLFLPSGLSIIVGVMVDFFKEKPSSSIVGMIAFFIFIAAGLVSLWIGIALLRAVAERYDGRPVRDVKIMLTEASTLIWPVIVATILSGLAIIG